MAEKWNFNCACSDNCGYKLTILFGTELMHVSIEDKVVFIDRNTARHIAFLIRKWVEKGGLMSDGHG